MTSPVWVVRSWHHNLAPILAVPLLLTASSGAVYWIARKWFDVDKMTVAWLMTIHQGAFVDGLKTPYTLLNALGAIFIACTGLYVKRDTWMRGVSTPPDFTNPRGWHKTMAIFAGIMLLFQALTGGGYRFCRTILALNKEQCGWLENWHAHMYLGPLSTVLVTLIAVAIVAQGCSGFVMNRNVRAFVRSEQVEGHLPTTTKNTNGKACEHCTNHG